MTQDLKLENQIYQNRYDFDTVAGGFLKFDISETIGSCELPLHTRTAHVPKRSFLGPESEMLTFRTFSFAVLTQLDQHNVVPAKCWS